MGASSSITNIPIYYSYNKEDLKYDYLNNLNKSIENNSFINIVQDIQISQVVVMCITNDIIRNHSQISILNLAMDFNIPILFINLQDNLDFNIKNALTKMGIKFTICAKDDDIENTIDEIQKTLIQTINLN